MPATYEELLTETLPSRIRLTRIMIASMRASASYSAEAA